MAFRPSLRVPALVLGLVIGLTAAPGRWPWAVRRAGLFGPAVQAQESAERNFTVAARKYAFNPAVINVQQDDLVRITFTTEDIPHSFTIDKYRIAKRVGPGQSVVFEFRADQPGRFPIYCNLTIDERCKEIHGELVVRGKQ
jgi:heme/copper-type cytochrome/quinol oxidase subunit 2